MQIPDLRPGWILKTLVACACLLGLSRLAVAAEAPSDKPTIFILGDSTARNNSKDRKGETMVGWGTPIADFFDPTKVAISNVAHAGQSSRTYYNIPGDWPRVLPQIKSGDFVLLVFGINDGGPPKTPRDRGSVPGIGDETVTLTFEDGRVETVHTYGWYMTAMATAAREKGAHVYFLTVTTRNIWTNPKAKFRDATPVDPLPADYDPKEDRIERGTANGKYTLWTKELGTNLHLPVFDLTNFCADRYETMGREAVDKLYSDHNHTYLAGAEIVAESIVSGLKAFRGSPFLAMLSEKGRAVATADAKYISDNAAPSTASLPPIQIADLPRHTQAGPPPESGRGIPAPFPANPALRTLWLIGDSTVRNGTAGDGGNGQWGWGAPLVAFFDLTKINVVNRAAGGTSARSFYNANWKKLVELLKQGDVVIMQFGTNDGGDPTKSVGELRGISDETQDITNRAGAPETVHTYGWYVRQMISEARAKGVTPIVCSLIPRKAWGDDGRLQRASATFGGWAAQIAKAENVGFIDLNEWIARRYDVLGKEKVDQLYFPLPTADKPRGESVHPGWEGAVLNAEIVVSGLKALPENPVATFFSARAADIAPAVP